MDRTRSTTTAAAALLVALAMGRPAHADQCAIVPALQALSALPHLPVGATILPLCEPCGEQVDPARVRVVRSVFIVPVDADSSRVRVNGEDVDLAYLYVRVGGVFRNVAMLAGCHVEHVSPSVSLAAPPPPSVAPHALAPAPPPSGAGGAITSCAVRNTGMLGMGAGREAAVGVMNNTTAARAFTVRIYAVYPGNGRESVAVSAVSTVPGVPATARVPFRARPGMVSILCEVDQ